MGGYGASRIGMKHPDVFGSLYIMSPCCLSGNQGARTARPGAPATPGTAATPPPAAPPAGPGPLEAIKTPADSAKLPFGLRAQLASAAAWSPDPKNPPLFLDLPTKDGEPQPDVQAKWIANGPLNFVDQYIGNLRRYHGIAMDVGDQDGLRFDAIKLHETFDRYGLENSFELYHGTHTSAVAVRFQNYVMPFFSKNLCFEQSCH
jgi:S-formylglutathione hydrolase FrmB